MNWDPEHADPAVGSFLPGLRWAAAHTTGPVLELGAGYFSTPYLRELSAERLVVSYEYDPAWAEEVARRFTSDRHLVFTEFDEVPPIGWAVVLVDCEGWNRQPFLDALTPRTEVFVVHDSQDPWVKNLGDFRYRHDFDENPRTTLVSNALDVRECGL